MKLFFENPCLPCEGYDTPGGCVCDKREEYDELHKKKFSHIREIEENLHKELARHNFSLYNPDYRKLDYTLSKTVRDIYKSYLNYLQLDPSKPLYTINGTKLATGFERIVIGDYGAFIEYDLSQVPKHVRYICEKGEEYRKLPNWRKRVKYIWYTMDDYSHIKIYWQMRTVSYADYKAKKFYVSPYQVIQ